MDKQNLKIDLRAVPYGSDSHVLEYRINPDQDLIYYKEHSLLFGLIKFKIKHKYSTKWHKPTRFFNGTISYQFPENDSFNNDFPIFVHSKDELQKLKNSWKTYEDFIDWYQKEDIKQRKEYWEKRNEYLKKIGIWE